MESILDEWSEPCDAGMLSRLVPWTAITAARTLRVCRRIGGEDAHGNDDGRLIFPPLLAAFLASLFASLLATVQALEGVCEL